MARWRLKVASVLAAGTAAGMAFAGPAAADGATAPRVPTAPVRLPSAVEPAPAYVPQDSCDYTVKPGTAALARLLQATYPDTGSAGMLNTCAAEGSTSEHAEGRAFDWRASVANPRQAAEVDAVLRWLAAPGPDGKPAAMAHRLGVMYVIWNKQLWTGWSATPGWRPYACSDITSCHQDHVHLSLTWAGAQQRTSFWTGQVAATDYGPCVTPGQTFALPRRTPNPRPCPAHTSLPASHPLVRALQADPGLVLRPGATGPAVTAVQRAIGGIPETGRYDRATADVVVAFQKLHRLTANGVVDRATWSALVAATTGGTATVPAATRRQAPGLDPEPAPGPTD